MKKYMYNKLSGLLCALSLFCVLSVVTTSCDDMLDKGNEYVIYAEDHVIADPADTVTSVMGILNKLQAIAVRTNLLGEVRADLVTVRGNATTDLKDLAELNITDDNRYNTPRDYYAVINNCNYFLAHADSTAGNANRNQKYFEAEIAQVHSIRAWTYLQMVLVYGRVPFVTEPVLTKLQSDAQYPMYDLAAICDYFINDLKPYYGKAYPEYGSIGGDIDPKMCFFPTQVVMGDLYLWKAVFNHDAEAAKQAAKAYYDYIVWDQNGKAKLTTGTSRAYWSDNALYLGRYSSRDMNSGLSYSTYATWGRSGTEEITAIPMDSAAADGYYNELRTLYNTQYQDDFVEASIEPSSVIRDLSKAQTYAGYNTLREEVAVTMDRFTEEELNEGYFGDLRFVDTYRQRTMMWNSEEVSYQSIYKHLYQHISIYRTTQVYLRLAEALNYAGYPRFAKQILTMGLSDNVIRYEVQPYYTTAADSAFIGYFAFSTLDFRPYADTYTEQKTSYGVTVSVRPTLRTSISDCNMWGIHGRGSGLPFLAAANYAPAHVVDSTGFPRELAAAVGIQPRRSDFSDPTTPTVARKPSTWDTYGNVTVDFDTYKTLNGGKSWYDEGRTNAAGQHTSGSWFNYQRKVAGRDSVEKYVYYLEQLANYEAGVAHNDSVYADSLAAYNARLTAFNGAFVPWYKAAYGNLTFIQGEQDDIDLLILNEQALEMVYEGNRFYDLMRRAYWYNDNSILANAVSKRDASVGSKLLTRSNWFLNWKGKIGM